MEQVNLRPYQKIAIAEVRQCFGDGMKRVCVYSPTGCHAKGTKILMADGKIKSVETLKIGEKVMGPDSRPRTILDLHSGRSGMYRINPIKGESFVVNGDHILSLMNTTTKAIVNISVNEWFSKSKNFKHLHKLWRIGVEFDHSSVDIDPYVMGVLLGDGCITQSVAISNPDEEIEKYITDYAKRIGCKITNRTYESSNCRQYAIVTDRGEINPILDVLRSYGVMGCNASTKHIPEVYQINSREVRLQILAGLLDTDGHFHCGNYEYVTKSENLIKGLAFIARSLGFACYYKLVKKSWQNGEDWYWKASISGELDEIPCKVKRKKASPRKQIKSVRVTGFSVEPMGHGNYYGFECDGDHLYLLEDFTVTHNSGKGELAVAIAQMAKEKSKRVLFLVHRKDLVKQQWERFAKYNIYPGILQGQNTNKPHSEITVGSIQTFSSRKKFGWQFDFDIIIIDEAHLCAGSEQYREFMRQHSNLPIIGLTATPFSKGMGKLHNWGYLFEEMVIVATIQDLIDRGFLVDCEMYAPSEPDLSKVKTVAGDYHQKQLGDAVDKQELIGDIVKHWFRLAAGQQTICFATNINHSKHIVEQFHAHGVSAEHLDCYSSEKTREDVIKRFRAGEIQVLSNVSLFAEGFDAPETSCMILARPTKSLIRYIQMVGRVLRPSAGKQMALVLDHSGSVSRLGFPTDDLPLELDDGKPAEKGKTENKKKDPKICPKCKKVDRQRRLICPACGFKAEIKKKEVEVKEGSLQKIVKMPHEAKQQIWSGLLTVARQKGYQSGWCAHLYKDITGVWPRGLADVSGPVPDFVQKMIIAKQIRYAKRRQA